MSSTCILSPTQTLLPIATISNSSSSCAASSTITPAASSTPPTIHPALRPSTMSQDNNNNNNNVDAYQSANEVLHDTVTLLSGNNGPRRVILSVYKTTVDHFALVYPDNRRKAVAIKPAGCINLRGVTCEETTLGAGLKGFTLRPKKCDTSAATLTFICSDASLLPKWLEALSAPAPNSTTVKIPVPTPNANRSFTTGPSPPCRRTAPRLSSLSSLDEEDEE